MAMADSRNAKRQMRSRTQDETALVACSTPWQQPKRKKYISWDFLCVYIYMLNWVYVTRVLSARLHLFDASELSFSGMCFIGGIALGNAVLRGKHGGGRRCKVAGCGGTEWRQFVGAQL